MSVTLTNVHDDQNGELVKTIDALHLEAEENLNREDLERARTLCKQARDLLQDAENRQQPYLRGLADNLTLTGRVDQFNGTQALSAFLEALSLLEHMDHPHRLVDACNGISWVYFSMGDYANAQAHVERSIRVVEQINDARRLSQTLNTAGAILSETNEPERAIQYLERNIANLLKESGSNREKCVAYNNLAMTLVDQRKFTRAEEAALCGLEAIQTENLPITEGSVLDTLGQVYKSKGDLQQSISCFERAIGCFNSIEKLGLDLEPYLHLGEVLMQKGDLDEAERCLLHALNVAQQLQVSRLEYLCHEKLSDLYEQRGDDRKALMYYRQFHTLKEKIFNQQSMQRMADLVSAHKMETALKDAEILKLRNTFLTQEIETEKRRYAELEHLATTDPLTGLFNRRHFQTLAQFEFVAANEKSLPLTVAMLDLDLFKNVNDQHGHAIGDQVLIQLAATLNSAIRREDLCCRYGGDEFVLLLPQLNLENGLAIANRVRTAIQDIRIIIGNRVIQTTVSAGVASMRPDDTSLDEIITRADQALLKAKAVGRNMVMAVR